jgi:DNA polymerase
VQPQVLVCLGASAAQALLGKDFRVSRERGNFVESALAPYMIATVHPSSILRAQGDESRHSQMKEFVEDLKKVAHLIRRKPPARVDREDIARTPRRSRHLAR